MTSNNVYFHQQMHIYITGNVILKSPVQASTTTKVSLSAKMVYFYLFYFISLHFMPVLKAE